MNISNNRLPNNIQIIHSSGNNTSKDKKIPINILFYVGDYYVVVYGV